jgi:sorbitol-specific phosphotransferase system component IIA
VERLGHISIHQGSQGRKVYSTVERLGHISIHQGSQGRKVYSTVERLGHISIHQGSEGRKDHNTKNTTPCNQLSIDDVYFIYIVLSA